MCGRYAATKDPATLAAEFDALDATEDHAPAVDYNVAPTKSVVAVVARHPRDDDGEPDPDRTVRSLRVMRWGLIPAWAKDMSVGARMINARSEKAATTPAFRTSVAKRRCLVPADGWYEWKRDGKAKQPFFMTGPDGHSLAMAGLWTVWRDPAKGDDAPPVVSVAVLTTEAIGQLGDIHDRMPKLLTPDRWASWLDPDADDVTELLETPPSLELVESLELRPVSTRVNNVRNNGPELLERDEEKADLTLFDER
ncbi:SOS response-associated peptidase [Actinophytocola sp.]|uniref:SOS response-associated peptidase n=1 Tax=Actinophytocola sp. TaxID=1872138 RepID=UPI002D528950|nr:SOS response-associated peptidase [Actinophytocola sp.]HYQ63309.1 SOS response-associated peptidase [Actinophytocola sp.]